MKDHPKRDQARGRSRVRSVPKRSAKSAALKKSAKVKPAPASQARELGNISRYINRRFERISELERDGKQLGHSMLQTAREIGDKLCRVKALLPHGRYEEWVRDNFVGGYSTAAVYKRIAIGWPKIAARFNSGRMSLQSALSLLSSKPPKPKAPKQPAAMRHMLAQVSEMMESWPLPVVARLFHDHTFLAAVEKAARCRTSKPDWAQPTPAPLITSEGDLHTTRADLMRQALMPLVNGVGRKNSDVEQASCFVFDGKHVRTFNGNVACKRSLPTPFTGAINADLMLGTLHKLEAAELRISTTEDGEFVNFATLERCFQFRPEKKILLPFREVETPKKWKRLKRETQRAIELAIPCVSERKPAQHSPDYDVHRTFANIHIAQDRVEACDNFQHVGLEFNTGVPEPVLVEGKLLRDFNKWCFTEFTTTPGWFHLRTRERVIHSYRRTTDLRYPRIKHSEKERYRFPVPEGIIEAFKNAYQTSRQDHSDRFIFCELEPGRLTIIGKYSDYNGPIACTDAVTLACQYDGPPRSFTISAINYSTLIKFLREPTEIHLGEKCF